MMTIRRGLTALMLAGLPAMSMAATNDLNCQGLVGGAMAQCLQGMGPASSRAAPHPSRQDSRAPGSDSRAVAFPATAPAQNSASTAANSSGIGSIGSSISSAITGLFSGWGVSSNAGRPTNCHGLVGGAMSQCLQGIGEGSGNPNPAGMSAAAEERPAESIKTNMSFGNNSLNCQGLAGGLLAQCLQGMEPDLPRSGRAASR